jgi:toxin ParE1/3/4
MVNWTISAKNDLKDIKDFIKKDSIFYSEKVVSEIVEKTKKLNDFPEIGRIVPELSDEKVREIIVYSYRIIYKICSDKIDILSVLHGARDFSKNIKL